MIVENELLPEMFPDAFILETEDAKYDLRVNLVDIIGNFYTDEEVYLVFDDGVMYEYLKGEFPGAFEEYLYEWSS